MSIVQVKPVRGAGDRVAVGMTHQQSVMFCATEREASEQTVTVNAAAPMWFRF
jgi:hypothetical protein